MQNVKKWWRSRYGKQLGHISPCVVQAHTHPSAPSAPSAPLVRPVHPVRPPAPACPSARSPAPSAPPPLSTRSVCASARTHSRPFIQQVVRPIVHRSVGQIDNKGTTKKDKIAVVLYPRPPSPILTSARFVRPFHPCVCPALPSVRVSVRLSVRMSVSPLTCRPRRPQKKTPQILMKNKHLDSRGKLSS